MVAAAVVLATLFCSLVGFDITELVVGPVVFIAVTVIIGVVIRGLTTVVSRRRQA